MPVLPVVLDTEGLEVTMRGSTLSSWDTFVLQVFQTCAMAQPRSHIVSLGRLVRLPLLKHLTPSWLGAMF